MIYEESGSILFRSCDFPPFLLLRKISGVGGPQFVVLNIWDSVLANRFLLGMGGEQAALVAGSRWGWFSVAGSRWLEERPNARSIPIVNRSAALRPFANADLCEEER